VTARSAFPVTPLRNLISHPVTGRLYWSGVSGIPGRPLYLEGLQYPGGRRFNGGYGAAAPAFTVPDLASAGNASRNKLRGLRRRTGQHCSLSGIVIERIVFTCN
jgi:hypothetical protein